MGKPGFSVFHMQDAAIQKESTPNQMHPITVERELEAAVIALVGDLAAYRPGATVVILEGDNSEFDRSMVGQLFPEFERTVNLISAGSRTRVRRLHRLLDTAAEKGGLPARFYSIVDRDSGGSSAAGTKRQFRWDKYHIENYLLEDEFILRVLRRLSRAEDSLDSMSAIAGSLKSAAEATLNSLVCHRLREVLNGYLVQTIGLRVSPIAENVAEEFERAVQSTISKINSLRADKLSAGAIKIRESEIRENLLSCLAGDTWRIDFRGRDILKRFSAEHLDGLRYEYFRDLIIAEMKDAGFQPAGMKSVIEQIQSGSKE